jgi:hypothetical protein
VRYFGDDVHAARIALDGDSVDDIVKRFREGEGVAGGCALLKDSKHPRGNSVADHTLTCCFGPEKKPLNRVKAEEGSQSIVQQDSQGNKMGQRRSGIFNGNSIKKGCLFKFMLKQYKGNEDSLAILVYHGEHTNESGALVHEGEGAPRLDAALKDRIYDDIVAQKSNKQIIQGELFVYIPSLCLTLR